MFQTLLIIALIYFGYKLLKNDRLKAKKREATLEKQQEEQKIAAGDMVQDPECGTFVSVDDSISVRNGNKVYYFCSYECRDKFLKKLDPGSTQRTHKFGNS